MDAIGNRLILLRWAQYFSLCGFFAIPIAGFPQMPFDAEAYYNRGRAYYLKRDYENAITNFGLAIKIMPNHANAYLKRGNAYYTRGVAYLNKCDKANAIFDFLKVLELTNDSILRQKTREQLQELR